jgi:hypothetical protein
MRPTERDDRSSLAVPRTLLVASATLIVAALVVAALPREIPLTLPGRGGRTTAEISAVPNVPVAESGVYWYDDLRMALRAGAVRPMFVLFTDPADPKCQRLVREVFSDRWSAMRIGQRFVCVRIVPGLPGIGGDGFDAQFMKERGVYVLPTILLLAPDGSPGDRIEGYPGRAEIMRRVTKWSDRYRTSGVTRRD